MNKEQLKKKIGKAVKSLRLHYRITQTELSIHSGVGRSTIVHIEKCKYMPTVYIALKIAKAFGLSLDELINFEENLISDENDSAK